MATTQSAADDDRVGLYIREFEALKTIRANWDTYWADVARHVLPNQNIFMRSPLGISQAERRTEYIFEGTAPQALERFAAAMESMLFPRTQKWHRLVPVDPNLKDNRDVRAYLEEINDVLFAARYSPRANFASQAHENMLGLGAFGTGSVFVDEDLGSNLRYRAINLQDLYFAENHVGLIETVFRVFVFSAINAVEQFGIDNVPGAIADAAKNSPQREYEFLHVVKPRRNPDLERKDAKGMAFESCYIALSHKQIVADGGYRTFPYATSRYVVGPREVYGRSPAMTSLADIKMLNEMSRTDIEASHMAVRPPLLVPDDDQRGWSLRPGALNYGGMGPDGKPMVAPLITGVRPDIAEEKMDVRRKSINDVFLVSLFQILAENPGQMTATEVLERAQEKGALLTPTMGRQQSEFLGPLIQREIDILGHANQFPPMPAELMRIGGQIKIEYSSPLNTYQRAEEGVGILRTFQQLAPLAEAGHPEVFDMFDPEATARELAEINAVPAKVMRSPEQIQQIQAAKQQQMNAQTMIQAAPQAAAAAKDLATARSTVLNSPGPQPGVGGPPA
jgi:hypothetical protein